jgi:hypothetical protein
MSSSRIVASAALTALVLSACGGPGNVSTGPGAMPQTNAAKTAGAPGNGERTAGVSRDTIQAKLFWRPDRLMLQKGVKQQAKLFYDGPRRPLRVADDCTGRVDLAQIGFARIKKYRINIYQVLALRGGPFHCSVVAKVRGEPLHAALAIEVAQ